MLIDTHAHYESEAFDPDRDEVINKLKSENIIAVNVGATVGSAFAAVELAEKYENIYAAIGVHPDEIGELNDDVLNKFLELAKHPKVVAIGEIGLDYHWDVHAHEEQIESFIKQIHLAKNMDLPVNIHSRDAAEDTMNVIRSEYDDRLRGIVHCYSYSLEHAKIYAKMGFYFGIGGVSTFSNSKKLKEVIEYVPIEQIVLETDTPYLAPSPHRGERNCSLYLPYVVSAIAQIKKLDEGSVAEQTTKNAREVYGKLS